MRYAFVFLLCAACVEQEPAEPKASGTALALTPTEIELGGERVVLIKDALRFDYLNIPSLEESLRELRASSPGVNPCAAIAAPPELPYRVVKRTTYTCSSVGFEDIGYTLAPASAPKKLAADHRRGHPLYAPRLMVVLTPSELRPTAGDGTAFGVKHLAAIPWAALLDAPAGTSEALGALATSFAKNADPGEPIAVLLAVEDSVPLAHLFAVREALQRAGLTLDVGPAS